MIADVVLVAEAVVFETELDAVDGIVHDLLEADGVADSEWLSRCLPISEGHLR